MSSDSFVLKPDQQARAQAAPFFAAIDAEIPVGPPNIPKLLELAARHGVAFAAQVQRGDVVR